MRRFLLISNSEVLSRLAKLEIFSDFNSGSQEDTIVLEKVCKYLDQKDFTKGSVIINEGDDGDILYILYQGSVSVLQNTPSDERFAVVNLQSEQNVFFGEVALIDHDKRSASVVAQTDCKTLTLTRKDFLDLCEEVPRLGYKACFKIAKRLAGSLRRSNMDILTLYDALLDEVSGTR
jgi:CRP/FNR family transcriptional regulator, cyclic AMP receptor protein